ncbi:MAG TPA: glycosyltransferase family 4 protein [Bryobacteraceae bacterium]|nr:glycosyltransferase family 4 protein [Bryobacteraceae bacterium]
MRRILMTTDTVGGVWSFSLELAEALGRRGIEVALAALGGLPTNAQRAEARRAGARLYESTFKLEWMEEPWADVEASGRWLLELEREIAPDLIHLNSYGHGALPWVSPVVLTAHSCVTSWWAAVKGGAPPEKWNRYRQEVKRSLDAVDMVTAPTYAMLSALRAHYGDLPRTRVVLNGRSLACFRRGPKEEFVLSAGRLWDEAKNIRALVEVAPKIAWPVYVAGEAGLADLSGCRALGRLPAPALAEWYARASIYALPACYEPFGLTALEAALSGCALVLGDIPSLREVWSGAAVFVAPADRRGLQSALGSLIHDRPRRIELAYRAYQRALEFGADRMALEYLSAYEEALGRKALCA